MEILESLQLLSKKIQQQSDLIKTEEATKNAFIMPFISNVLGYDVFDPKEVVPEFISDIGTKKGEKVDYAIKKEDQIQILIECKKIGEELNINHASQLFRYFHATNARIAILTNGHIYQFYTDLDAPNKMDDKPFLELNMLDIDESLIPELTKLTKASFDIDSIMSAAEELKYLSQLRKVIVNQLSEPEDEFVRFFASRVYEGMLTQKVRELFSALTKRAFTQYLNDQINDRLKSAIFSGKQPAPIANEESTPERETEDLDDGIVTTEEELEGFYIIKAIVRAVVDSKRIVSRDTQSYFGILLDDNNRKPICRLHFNRAQKYIGVFDNQKNETRIPINHIDDIYQYGEQLKQTALFYG